MWLAIPMFDRFHQIPNGPAIRVSNRQLIEDLPILAPILKISTDNHDPITTPHPDLGMVLNDPATYLLHFTDSQILQQKGVPVSHVF
jgi:hypothetical protein